MIKVKSTKLLDRLKQLRSKNNLENISVSLEVPPELFWWIFLEFGTGSRGDVDTGGYTIEAHNTKMLHFFEAISGEERFAESVYMPGIPAFHMITSIYGEIEDYKRLFIREKLVETDYDFNAVKELIYTEMMPKIKEMIVDSFRENLPNHVRELGRLTMTATQAFEEGLEIV